MKQKRYIVLVYTKDTLIGQPPTYIPKKVFRGGLRLELSPIYTQDRHTRVYSYPVPSGKYLMVCKIGPHQFNIFPDVESMDLAIKLFKLGNMRCKKKQRTTKYILEKVNLDNKEATKNLKLHGYATQRLFKEKSVLSSLVTNNQLQRFSGELTLLTINYKDTSGIIMNTLNRNSSPRLVKQQLSNLTDNFIKIK